jgi:acyl carrier protein
LGSDLLSPYETALVAVKAVLRDIKGEELAGVEITEDTLLWDLTGTAPSHSLELDSLDVLDLIVTLEEDMRVEVLDDVEPESLQSVGALASVLVEAMS